MEEKVNWIDKMIERQTLPQPIREGTVEEFCVKYGISRSTYYYQVSLKENQDRIIKICLRIAKEYTPEVLNTLAQKAKDGDMKAIDMFLNYVLELSENLDIKSKGNSLINQDIFKYVKWLNDNKGNGENTETN